MPATVDAEMFETIETAIAFVASCGGGVVYTELADTLYVKNLKRPPSVTLALRRVEAEPRDGVSQRLRQCTLR